MKALASCVVVLGLAALAGAVDAQACSCAPPDPRTALRDADGAFVGRLVATRPGGNGHVVMTFAVERAVKGAIGATVEVRTRDNGAACGIETSVGERIGLLLLRQSAVWTGHLCWQVSPQDLLAAAAPLPAPNGSGPVAMYVGGAFDPARTIALDSRGRTLAYGLGRGSWPRVSPCPGGRLVAEIAEVTRSSQQRATYEIAIRRAHSLQLARRQRVRLPGLRFVTGLRCDSSTGASVVVFASWAGDAPQRAALYRITRSRTAPLWQGTGFVTHLSARRAYIRTGFSADRLVAVDLRTRRVTPIVRLPLGADLVPSADGRKLAGLAWRLDRKSRIFLVDLAGTQPVVRSVALASAEVFGEVLWLSRARLVFVPSAGEESTRVLDLRLRTRSRFDFTADDAILHGRMLFGIRGDRLLSASPAERTSRVVRQLPGRAESIASAGD